MGDDKEKNITQSCSSGVQSEEIRELRPRRVKAFRLNETFPSKLYMTWEFYVLVVKINSHANFLIPGL